MDLGGHVEIHRVETTIATSITLTIAPPEEVPRSVSFTLVSSEAVTVPFGFDLAEMVKRLLFKRPVVEGDIIPLWVNSNSNYAVPHLADQAIVLQVVATDPTGGVLATDETSVSIQDWDE